MTLIGQWMVQQAAQCASVNFALPGYQLNVYPTYPDEQDIGKLRISTRFTKEGVQELMIRLAEVAVILEAKGHRK